MAARATDTAAEPGDGEMEWPDDAQESAFLSESLARGEAPAPASSRAALPVIGDKLPSLEELVAQVPPGVTALLDDLFRAKFTGVRKYPEAVGAGSAPK
jgi:hypothetical protein